MAIYSLSAVSISRAGGKSAVAAAAYRSGETLNDDRQGLRHDYTRKSGVLHSEIVMPKVAPIWAGNRERLWNEVDRAEDKSTRRNEAQTARDFRIALPHELSAAQRIEVSREFSRFLVERYGAIVDFAIHAPGLEGDERNFHAHVLMTTRSVDENGFGAKIRSLSSPLTSGAEMQIIRQGWQDIANAALERTGFPDRIDRRSNVAQGRDAEPTIHMGVAASGMERKGEITELGNLNRDIQARNAERTKLKAEHSAVTAEIVSIEAEREKRQDERFIAAAAKTLDPARMLAGITEKRSTFTRGELNSYLRPHLQDTKARSAFMDTMLALPDVVGLAEQDGGPISRYTSRAVLEQEKAIFATADRLAGNSRHGLTAGQLADTLDHHSHLDDEQRNAVAHATDAKGFAIIAGEAGTGKSTTFAAIREAYEAAGYRVKGTAWTNAVKGNLVNDGFREAETVQTYLFRLANGRERWDSRTIIMLDEGAQLADNHLTGLMNAADKAGAKLIVAQDRKQLGSIERGGMAAALEDRHAPARLTKVYRTRDDGEKTALNDMHKGDFRSALATFDKRGAIHWQKDTDTAQAALVQTWADDTKARPDKSRFVFAYTNAEVHSLNDALRAIRKERGELGADHLLKTAEGEKAFSVGDRVQFTGSAYDAQRRAAGLYNGAVGTITDVQGKRVTVGLDGQKDGKPLHVSFVVGENREAGEFNAMRHGYAGTIYKGQGKTLDEAYLLHSDNWRAATSYVALSRHRDSVNLFAAEKSPAWMMAEGGLASLTEAQRRSAEKSYAAWAEMKPQLAARYPLADYVAYVQTQAAQQKDMARLDRMAAQMGRVEERRAASQYFTVTPQRPKDAPAPKPPIYGRYGELKALQERLGKTKGGVSASSTVNPASPEPSKPQTPAERYAAAIKALDADSSESRNEAKQGRDHTPDRHRPPDRGRSR